MGAVLAHREIKPLLSTDHFSVDGTLIEAWASLISFRAKVGSDKRLRRGAAARAGSKPSSVGTTRIGARPTPTPSFIARATLLRRSSATSGMH
jgi:hypothetical protein